MATKKSKNKGASKASEPAKKDSKAKKKK